MKAVKHTFDQDEVKILDTEDRFFQRGVKEAVYIAAVKPDLNQALGRHPLPSAYKKLIESCDLGLNSRSRDSICGPTSTSKQPSLLKK